MVGQTWPLLDSIRIGAALLVVLGHCRFLYFGTPENVAQSSIWRQLFYLFTGLGHEAVVLFFVLSGFLVGGQILASKAKGVFDPWAYFVNRFVRIYIVFIPALVLAFGLDQIGANFLTGTAAHKDLLDGWSDFNFRCYLGCLQGVACAAHANPPLWSLGYEWLLYLFAPAVFGILFSSYSYIVRLCLIALLAVVFQFALAVIPDKSALGGELVWKWFLIWFLGAAAYWIVNSRCLPTAAGIFGIFCVAVAFLLARSRIVPPFASDCMIAVGLALTISSRLLLVWRFFPRGSANLAGFSYSLYAIHLPIIVFSARILEAAHLAGPHPEPTLRAGSDFLLTVAIALVGAIGFSRLTEAETTALRRFILKRRTAKAPRTEPTQAADYRRSAPPDRLAELPCNDRSK